MSISLSFLVVDDSSVMSRMLKNTIKSLGHNVIGECQEPKQALKMYKELKPDIVTMDINMPGHTGIDVLKEIIDENNDAIVVMITAEGMRKSIIQSLNNGAKGYLLKPIAPEKLRETINKIITKYFQDRVNTIPEVDESSESDIMGQ